MHTFYFFFLWLVLMLSCIFWKWTTFLPWAFIIAPFISPLCPYLQKVIWKWKGTRRREGGESSSWHNKNVEKELVLDQHVGTMHKIAAKKPSFFSPQFLCRGSAEFHMQLKGFVKLPISMYSTNAAFWVHTHTLFHLTKTSTWKHWRKGKLRETQHPY